MKWNFSKQETAIKMGEIFYIDEEIVAQPNAKKVDTTVEMLILEFEPTKVQRISILKSRQAQLRRGVIAV